MRKPAPPARPRSLATPRPAVRSGISETEFHLSAARLLRLGVPPEGFFYHVPNQGRRSIAGHQMTTAMGMIPGLTDLVLAATIPHVSDLALGQTIRVTATAYLELKRPDGTGKLRPAQVAFRDFCQARGIPWGEAKSLEEVAAFARQFYESLGLQWKARL